MCDYPLQPWPLGLILMRDTNAVATIHSNFTRDTSEPSAVLSFCFIFHIAINARFEARNGAYVLLRAPLASG